MRGSLFDPLGLPRRGRRQQCAVNDEPDAGQVQAVCVPAGADGRIVAHVPVGVKVAGMAEQLELSGGERQQFLGVQLPRERRRTAAVIGIATLAAAARVVKQTEREHHLPVAVGSDEVESRSRDAAPVLLSVHRRVAPVGAAQDHGEVYIHLHRPADSRTVRASRGGHAEPAPRLDELHRLDRPAIRVEQGALCPHRSRTPVAPPRSTRTGSCPWSLKRRAGGSSPPSSTASPTPEEIQMLLGSFAGGKLTTHRLISLSALNELPVEVRPRRLGLDDTPITTTARPSPELDDRLRDAVGAEGLRYLVELRGLATPEVRTRLAELTGLPHTVRSLAMSPAHSAP